MDHFMLSDVSLSHELLSDDISPYQSRDVFLHIVKTIYFSPEFFKILRMDANIASTDSLKNRFRFGISINWKLYYTNGRYPNENCVEFSEGIDNRF